MGKTNTQLGHYHRPADDRRLPGGAPLSGDRLEGVRGFVSGGPAVAAFSAGRIMAMADRRLTTLAERNAVRELTH
jgi:hypothetical protein